MTKNFFHKINDLNKHHYKNSPSYKKIVDILFHEKKFQSLNDIPYLPVNLFKHNDLKSIKDRDVFKILKSSGTTTGIPSRIFLDKKNAKKQSEVLNLLLGRLIGKKRFPMIIVGNKSNIIDKRSFDAKTAAVLGFSLFAKEIFYLNESNEINYEGLNRFIKKNANERFILFGFTFDIYQILINDFKLKNLKYHLNSNSIIIHGGGWKKLENKKISKKKLNFLLSSKFKIKNIINYYGLIEQTGSIFFDCKICGSFVTSEYSDIIIRDNNFNILKSNQKGFVQLLSSLPTSYPGHSILTEDIGEIVENNCKCKKIGKRFLIHGRTIKSEVRGCSDV